MVWSHEYHVLSRAHAHGRGETALALAGTCPHPPLYCTFCSSALPPDTIVIQCIRAWELGGEGSGQAGSSLSLAPWRLVSTVLRTTPRALPTGHGPRRVAPTCPCWRPGRAASERAWDGEDFPAGRRAFTNHLGLSTAQHVRLRRGDA